MRERGLRHLAVLVDKKIREIKLPDLDFKLDVTGSKLEPAILAHHTDTTDTYSRTFNIAYRPLENLKRDIPYMNIDTKKIAYKEGLVKELTPANVIFNPPATIVFWEDGEKTVVKCGKDELYDKEKGLSMAFCKRVWGNAGRFNNMFEKWCFGDEDDIKVNPTKANNKITVGDAKIIRLL